MSLAWLLKTIFFLLCLGAVLFFGRKVVDALPGPTWSKQLIYVLVGLFLFAVGIQLVFGVEVISGLNSPCVAIVK